MILPGVCDGTSGGGGGRGDTGHGRLVIGPHRSKLLAKLQTEVLEHSLQINQSI